MKGGAYEKDSSIFYISFWYILAAGFAFAEDDQPGVGAGWRSGQKSGHRIVRDQRGDSAGRQVRPRAVGPTVKGSSVSVWRYRMPESKKGKGLTPLVISSTVAMTDWVDHRRASGR